MIIIFTGDAIMGEYTETLESIGYDIDLFENDPEDNVIILTNVASSFRTFDEAITLFIQEHGYEGNTENEIEKINYLSKKFSDANIPIPRNIKRWFYEKIGIEKYPTGYQFCFAFGLNISESNEFFRKICLEKGIDCHVIEEAVFYYCLKNNISYSEAVTIIEEISKEGTEGIVLDVPYTSAITLDLDRIKDAEELKSYLIKNNEYFAVNKVTATKHMRRMWEDISSQSGLANEEKKENFFDGIEDDNIKKKKKEIKARSTWEIYKQILGLDGFKNPEYEKNRSIKSILRSNPMLCQIAEKDFPDRLGIDNIIAGRVVSAERMRKDLILLSYYRYWIKLAIERQCYDAEGGDADRCQAQMNQILLDSGYQELYYGNPYDWIFLFSMQTEMPLSTFRDYIATLGIAIKEE